MLLLAALSMTMVSCDDNWDSPYYVDDIVGSWISYYGHYMKGEYDIIFELNLQLSLLKK